MVGRHGVGGDDNVDDYRYDQAQALDKSAGPGRTRTKEALHQARLSALKH